MNVIRMGDAWVVLMQDDAAVKRTAGNWQGAIVWVALAGLVGYLDFVTGPFVSLTLFYLIPVVGASWFVGWAAGAVVAATAGGRFARRRPPSSQWQ